MTFHIRRCADNGESYQMRQVGGDSQNLIVMRWLHDFDHRTGRAPKIPNPLNRCLIGTRRRRKNAPTAVEQVL